jgi:hypothetical protein
MNRVGTEFCQCTLLLRPADTAAAAEFDNAAAESVGREQIERDSRIDRSTLP